MNRKEIVNELINKRERIDFESWVISAVENPQNQIANFDELREKAISEDKYSNKKIVHENNKIRTIVKIKWDKNKFFFSYELVVLDKLSNEKNKRILGTDDAHFHNPHRHLHSGNFVIPNPETLLEKIEHPILSLIINSESEERKKEWIKKLANELKDSQVNWVKYTFNKK